MKKIVLGLVSFVTVSNAQSFKDCYNFFEKEQFFKAEKCFYQINKDDIYYPYSLSFLIKTEKILDENTYLLEKEIQNQGNYAVSHYTYLFLAKKYLTDNIEKALFYIQKVDEKALLKEDVPFFLYLKGKILEKTGRFDEAFKIQKRLALKYPYDRFYGYKTAVKLLPVLVDEEIYSIIDNLFKHRMPVRASYFLRYLDNSQKKLYYQIKVYSRLGKRKLVRKLLKKADKNSPFYEKILPYKIAYAYKKEKKAKYIQELKDLGLKEKANKIALGYMRLAFYTNKPKKLKFYGSLIDKNSSAYKGKVWFTFLQKYREKDFFDAATYLEEHLDIFTGKEKNRIYYWLFLSFKHFDRYLAKYYLKKAAFSDYTDFYSFLAQRKLKVKKVSFRNFSFREEPVNLEKNYQLVYSLKSDGFYRFAYIEAEYLKKKAKSPEDFLKLSVVFPEKTARYFSYKLKSVDKAFPKPFSSLEKDNIVYAIMRQESFFDTYALSYSNAIGLMQIMPYTGRWIAKKLGEENFSIYRLFEPETNIRYGKWYIEYLLKKFNGNIFFAAAGYNSGGGRVKRFLKRHKIKDIAEFVELYPYSQTRHYVKKVYENYVIYNQLSKRLRYVYRSY